jgi:hypothetical protein
VDHAIAVEPVVAAARVELGIGPIADVDPVEVVGNPTDDLQVSESDLLVRRLKRATEVRIVGGELALQGLYMEADRRILVNLHAPLRESTRTSPKLLSRAGQRGPGHDDQRGVHDEI